jgi:hypothetical protein
LRHAEEGHCDSNECYEGKRDNRTREVDHEKSITFKLEQLAKTKFDIVKKVKLDMRKHSRGQ